MKDHLRYAALILIGLTIGHNIPEAWLMEPTFLLIVGLISGALLALLLVRL